MIVSELPDALDVHGVAHPPLGKQMEFDELMPNVYRTLPPRITAEIATATKVFALLFMNLLVRQRKLIGFRRLDM